MSDILDCVELLENAAWQINFTLKSMNDQFGLYSKIYPKSVDELGIKRFMKISAARKIIQGELNRLQYEGEKMMKELKSKRFNHDD